LRSFVLTSNIFGRDTLVPVSEIPVEFCVCSVVGELMGPR